MSPIVFGDDCITINDKDGEIVTWLIDEWIEDPQIVFAICNAVKMHIEGKNIREIINEGLK